MSREKEAPLLGGATTENAELLDTTSPPPGCQAALRYAELGHAVLPLHSIKNARCTCGNADCTSPGKHPRTTHGLKDASTDADLIRCWWRRSPKANVGIRCDGFVALDVDPRHNGDHALAGLLAEHGELPETPHQFTGGGGHHYLFAQPDPPIGNGKLCDGLEYKGAAGYIVAEPSNHACGGGYIFEDEHGLGEIPLAPLPGWLLDLIGKKTKAPTGNGRAPRKASGLLLALDRQPDAGKLDALLANDPKVLATWEKRRPDLSDTSPSGYDLSLAGLARGAGWNDQEIVDLLTARRTKHGDNPEKMLRADYVKLTLDKALSETAHSIAEPAGPGAVPDGDTAREWLRERLGLDIDRLEKLGSCPATYDLVLRNGARVRFGSSGELLTPSRAQAAVLDAVGLILPHLSRKKWERVVAVLLKLAVNVHPEISDADRLRERLELFAGNFDRVRFNTGDPASLAGALNRLCERELLMDEGEHGYISATKLRAYLADFLKELVAHRDLCRELARAGFVGVQLSARYEGKAMKGRFWKSPPGWFGDDALVDKVPALPDWAGGGR